MTHQTFAELQKLMCFSISETKNNLEKQYEIAKRYYKMACNEYGSHSDQADKWIKMYCALQIATETLATIPSERKYHAERKRSIPG